jgi:hypothetical protein
MNLLDLGQIFMQSYGSSQQAADRKHQREQQEADNKWQRERAEKQDATEAARYETAQQKSEIEEAPLRAARTANLQKAILSAQGPQRQSLVDYAYKNQKMFDRFEVPGGDAPQSPDANTAPDLVPQMQQEAERYGASMGRMGQEVAGREQLAAMLHQQKRGDPTEMSRKVTEAYNVQPGTPEHQKIMQGLIGPGGAATTKEQADEAARKAAFEFEAGRQVRRNPAAADALEADAASMGVQVPGTRVTIAGDDRPIEVPPDLATARARAEGLGVEVKAPDAEKLYEMAQKDPRFKAAEATATAYSKIRGATDDSVGHLTTIYGMMNILDPGGRVTDGDYQAASTLGGDAGKFFNAYQRFFKGDKMDGPTFERIKAEASRIYRDRMKDAAPVVEGLRQKAMDAGIAPDRVLPFGLADDIEGVVNRQNAAGRAPAGPTQERQPSPDKTEGGAKEPAPPPVISGATPGTAAEQLFAEGKLSPRAIANQVRARYKLTKEQSDILAAKLNARRQGQRVASGAGGVGQ